jgi:hypothetical protein
MFAYGRPGMNTRTTIALAGAVGLLAAGMAVMLSTASGASSTRVSTVTYSYRTVKVAGEVNSQVLGLNVSGAYTGLSCNSTCTKVKMFVAAPSGKRTFFTVPFKNYSPTGGTFSEDPSGIDNAGDVVGYYLDSKGSAHGFERLADGKLIEINDPNATDEITAGTFVNGISFDGSVIVGNYIDAKDVSHGFLLRAGKFTTYDVPKAAATVVEFYNYGEFGGEYVSSTGAHFGFYVSGGKLHTVIAPGESKPGRDSGTDLLAVSSDKTLFGDVVSTTKQRVGFADTDGSFTTINDPNEVGTTVFDGTSLVSVSPTGDLCGYYSYTAGTTSQFGLLYGFIATPTTSSPR